MFFVNKLKELYQQGKCNSYYQSLIYTFGICETTRNNFNKLFDTKEEMINIDAMNSPWQTGTSRQVTRMAFNLWNGCMYDSEQDAENREISKNYSPDELFCCSYAPYFYEGIKLRYPEYARQVNNEKER